jgi:hypothetical protein
VNAQCAAAGLRTTVDSDEGITMRGDWIYDWVRVEMEYRADAGRGTAVSRQRTDGAASGYWRTLWAGLFTHRPPVSRGDVVA